MMVFSAYVVDTYVKINLIFQAVNKAHIMIISKLGDSIWWIDLWGKHVGALEA
jgi:hypothetical protein